MKQKIVIGALLMIVSLSVVACSFGEKEVNVETPKTQTTETPVELDTEKEHENETATEETKTDETMQDTIPEGTIPSTEESHAEKNPKVNVSEELAPLLTPAQEEKLIEEQLEANNDWIDEFRETKGCPICKDTDCPSLYGKDQWGQDDIDLSLCPDYNLEDDPLITCTHCGKKKGDGTNDTCVRYLEDTICEHCGDEVLLLECHTCEN